MRGRATSRDVRSDGTSTPAWQAGGHCSDPGPPAGSRRPPGRVERLHGRRELDGLWGMSRTVVVRRSRRATSASPPTTGRRARTGWSTTGATCVASAAVFRRRRAGPIGVWDSPLDVLEAVEHVTACVESPPTATHSAHTLLIALQRPDTTVGRGQRRPSWMPTPLTTRGARGTSSWRPSTTRSNQFASSVSARATATAPAQRSTRARAS